MPIFITDIAQNRNPNFIRVQGKDHNEKVFNLSYCHLSLKHIAEAGHFYFIDPKTGLSDTKPIPTTTHQAVKKALNDYFKKCNSEQRAFKPMFKKFLGE